MMLLALITHVFRPGTAEEGESWWDEHAAEQSSQGFSNSWTEVGLWP